MGTSISSGRWKLDYTNRLLYRDISITPTVTDPVLTLYSDIQDLFDVSGQMDDPTPMSAQTPAEFTVGDPEGNDSDFPWFVSPESCKYLSGGAIQTSSWTRTEGSENGIVVVPYDNSVDPVASDIGKAIVHDDGDSGVLLGFDVGRGELYIRPDSDVIGNSFNSVTGDMDVTAGTANVGSQTAAATTGEFLWANPYSLAPSLQPGTRIYAVQDTSKLGGTDWPASIGLNADGQNDILTIVKVADALIDEGYITFFARRGGTVYSHSVVDLSGGGRVPIPLSPQDNALNDGLGHYNATWTGGSGSALVAGDIVTMDSDSEIAALVVAATDGGATGDFDYFLIRGLTQLSAAAASAESPSTKAMTIAVVSDLQPVTDAATISPLVFGAISRDINNGAGSRFYSIEVDPNSLSFVRVYRALEFMLRRGSTESLDGVDGEQYLGSTVHLNYSGQAGGEFTEGNVVWGQTSGAFGTVVADHVSGAEGDLILRATRGTFLDTEQVGDTETGPTVTADIDTVRSIPTLPSAVLGNIAGGVYFGAPGMFFTLANIASGEAQLYQLVDDLGEVQVPPNTVTVEVTGLGIDDWVSVFRLDAALSSGGQIVKNEYTSHATNNAAGDNTLEVQSSLSAEVPPSGPVRVEYAADAEDYYWFSSQTGLIFTLLENAEAGEEWDGTRSATSASADGSTLTDSGAAFDGSGAGPAVQPGMIVRNTTDGSYGIVKSVDSATQITLETDIFGTGQGLDGGTEDDWDVSDAYQINRLRQTYDGSDNVYCPFIDQKNVAGTDEVTTIIQSTGISVKVSVRQGKVILPFTVGQTIGSTGMSQAAIRNPDNIAT